MTHDEERMLEFLQTGEANAIKVPYLQYMFGANHSDPQIRAIVRDLINVYKTPIIGGGYGYFKRETKEEAEKYKSNLLGRSAKILYRFRNFCVADSNNPVPEQTELF